MLVSTLHEVFIHHRCKAAHLQRSRREWWGSKTYCNNKENFSIVSQAQRPNRQTPRNEARERKRDQSSNLVTSRPPTQIKSLPQLVYGPLNHNQHALHLSLVKTKLKQRCRAVRLAGTCWFCQREVCRHSRTHCSTSPSCWLFSASGETYLMRDVVGPRIPLKIPLSFEDWTPHDRHQQKELTRASCWREHAGI